MSICPRPIRERSEPPSDPDSPARSRGRRTRARPGRQPAWARSSRPGVPGDREGEWKLRCLVQEIPMPWDWPVEVNYLEAKAFCTWKSAQLGKPIRLPTEEEWFVANEGGTQTPYFFGEEAARIGAAQRWQGRPSRS